MRFDEVLPAVVRVCEGERVFGALERVCVLRDFRGQIRLVVKVAPGAAPAIDTLEAALKKELGAYFSGPIWSTAASGEEGRLATRAIDLFEPWKAPPDMTDPFTGARKPATANRWFKLERRLSKEVWFETQASKAQWALAKDSPAIVTFYSFKGGVGRTTALVACAWQWARQGKRVAVIDLDLEAPGVGTLLEADTDRGVVDFLVESMATGRNDLDGLHKPAAGLGADGQNVEVFPAGTLTRSYLEKLARLDFLASGSFIPDATKTPSPVEQALRKLLAEVRAIRPRFDYILLDSRAGLHDLAGLSLHGLAHVDVVVGRHSAQSHAGLELTLETLGRRRGKDLLCVVVHAMAPPSETSEDFKAEARAFNAKTYDAFVKHAYGALQGNIPAEDDRSAAHAPISIHRHEALERFGSIRDRIVENDLFGPDYEALRKKIDERCAVKP